MVKKVLIICTSNVHFWLNLSLLSSQNILIIFRWSCMFIVRMRLLMTNWKLFPQSLKNSMHWIICTCYFFTFWIKSALIIRGRKFVIPQSNRGFVTNKRYNLEELNILEIWYFIFSYKSRHSMKVRNSHKKKYQKSEEMKVNQSNKNQNKWESPTDSCGLIKINSCVKSCYWAKEFSYFKFQMKIIFIWLHHDC